MKRNVAVALAIALIAILAWWLYPRDRTNRDADPPPPDPRSPAARRATTPVHVEKGLPTWFGQPGAPARRIAGKVVLDGAPVAARVTLSSAATEAGAVPPEVIETGADGAFDFGIQVAASYTVSASRDGAAPAIEPVDLRNPTARPAPDAIVLELSSCDHTVGGVVRDASGGVVAGARVRIERFGHLAAGVRSGGDGAYLACVPRGRVSLHFVAEGYGAVERELDATGHMTYDARLTPEGVVSGRVVGAGQGAPIAGALVEIGLRSWRSNERAAGASTVTGPDGRFRLAGLAAADMNLRAHAPGWVMADDGRELSVRPAQSIDGVVIEMVPASSIAGAVVARDEPVAGAIISWNPFGGGTGASAVTQTDGSFSLDALSPGTGGFDVRGYEVLEPDQIEATAERTEGIVVTVEAMASIAGTCVRAGAPVPDCDVFARPSAGAGAGTTAGADGTFELRGLTPATYQLNADSEQAGAFAASQTVTVDRGQRVDGVVLELGFAATVAGTVVDQRGVAVPGATVNLSLLGGRDYGEARTGRDGVFFIDRLSGGGAYAVTVRAPDSRAVLAPAAGKALPNVDVPGPDSRVTGVRFAVVLETGTIAGAVVTADGAPVADAQIAAEVMTGERVPHFSGWTDVPRTTTDQDGRFELRVAGPATFAVQAVSPGGAGKIVTGIDMGARDVRIALDPTGAVAGTVAGFAVDPRIEIDRRGRDEARAVATASGGRFRFDGLPAGDYAVEAKAGLEHVRGEVTVVAGETATIHLESHGVGRLEVYARDVRTGAPLAGVFCNVQPWTEGAQFVSSSQDPSTDGAGYLTMRSPAGRVRATCRGPGQYSMPIVAVEVPTGGTATVRVALFERDQVQGRADFGFEVTATDDALTVSAVAAGGPAAGKLQVGDVIVVIDGLRVADVTARAADGLLVKPAGAALALTVVRSGETVDVVLQSSTLSP